MITWVRIDSGEYMSEDGRFYILKTHNNIYGNHWQLRDNTIDDYYKGLFYEYTLKDCKAKAEAILHI